MDHINAIIFFMLQALTHGQVKEWGPSLPWSYAQSTWDCHWQVSKKINTNCLVMQSQGPQGHTKLPHKRLQTVSIPYWILIFIVGNSLSRLQPWLPVTAIEPKFCLYEAKKIDRFILKTRQLELVLWVLGFHFCLAWVEYQSQARYTKLLTAKRKVPAAAKLWLI